MEATHLRVTNNNDFTIEDRYDGIFFAFAPKKPVVIPVAAGVLFFGFTLDENGFVQLGEGVTAAPDQNHMQRRWGWNTVERKRDEELSHAVQRTNDRAKKWSSAITIEPIVMGLREVRQNELLAPRADDALSTKSMLAG